MTKELSSGLFRPNAVIFSMILLVCSCINGCAHFRTVKQEDPFRLLYDAASVVKPVSDSSSSVTVPKLTLSAHLMPLSLFVRVLSDRFTVGVVFSDSLQGRTVTAEFKDADLATVFTVLSRQLGVDVVKLGNTFYLGKLDGEDKGVLVRRMLSYDSDALNKAVSSLLSTSGRVEILENSIVLVSDKDFVLRRVGEALDYLESLSVDCWIVQLYFVVLRKDALAEAGFSMTSSGTISYNISENTVDLKDFKLEGIFNGLLESTYADLYASPMFILRDGVSGEWKDGQRVPIPKKTVSDYGTVTTNGFDYIETGLKVKTSVRETKKGGLLNLSISFSDIQSYVEYSPVTGQTACDVTADLQSGKIYLLSELQKYSMIDREQKTLLFGRDSGKTVLQIWGKIYKISGGPSVSPPRMPDTGQGAEIQKNSKKD